MKFSSSIFLVGVALSVVSCATVVDTAASAAKENFLGIHKRDTLMNRVEKARDAQQETKEQFADALEEFSSVMNFDGGDLGAKYKQLKTQYDRSKSRADEVGARNDDVERTARALFREWEAEIDQFTNPNFKTSSERQLRAAQDRYATLSGALRKAEASIDPVLKVFGEQVLFLKHNLNSQAIASIQGEVDDVTMDVNRLIKEMEIAIAEADAFIKTMEQ